MIAANRSFKYTTDELRSLTEHEVMTSHVHSKGRIEHGSLFLVANTNGRQVECTMPLHYILTPAAHATTTFYNTESVVLHNFRRQNDWLYCFCIAQFKFFLCQYANGHSTGIS